MIGRLIFFEPGRWDAQSVNLRPARPNLKAEDGRLTFIDRRSRERRQTIYEG